MMPLLVSHNDGPSGAGRAVARLHQGLLQAGVPSRLLVAHSQAALAETRSPAGPLRRGIATARGYADQLPLLMYPGRERTFFSTAWFAGNPASVARQSLDYHLVHLHWINGGFARPSAFARFGKPLVWTIHDSWAFTGGCHVPGDCTRYENKCGACPRLGSRRKLDLSRMLWYRKKNAWRNLEITLIAPSTWIAHCVRRSALLGSREVHVIPNGIDTRIYQPFDRATARRRLGLPLDQRIILFGAINATEDHNKGYDLLQTALAHFTKKHRPGTGLAIFGSQRDPRGGEKLIVAGAPSGGLPVYQLGGFHDDLALALVYSAADVMCVPSRQESFGQTAAEAMACGTPVVAFGATGLLDIVDHKKNGYLARPYDPEDFAAGIDFVLRAPRLGPAARKKVERAFALEQVARRHIELYDSLT